MRLESILILKCDYRHFLDFIISAILLALLSPLFVFIAIILLIIGDGNIFFKQNRVGQYGRNFELYKFATMKKNTEDLKNVLNKEHWKTLFLPFGKTLRKIKFNELPQLYNILSGDMSFIGPRPLVYPTFLKYNKKVSERIILLKPGLTGLGSLVFRNEEEIMLMENEDFYELVIIPYKAQLEFWYARNLSFKNDMLILFLTISSLFSPSYKIIKFFFRTMPPLPTKLSKYIF
jgi:lipopolysaccharide/colanic/teichoic acid biosynthesis glycosyltransferase